MSRVWMAVGSRGPAGSVMPGLYARLIRLSRSNHRDLLLEAAKRLLRDKGYANTTARDLVAASGTNLASIGYHFGGKEALMKQAVAETTRAWMSAIEAEVWKDATEHPAEHLSRMFEATLDRFEELEPYLRSFVEAFPP